MKMPEDTKEKTEIDYSNSNFVKDIKEILFVCTEDLHALSIGQTRQATKEQIEGTIIPEMNRLLEMAQNNELPPISQRWILSSAYITRDWNWDIWSNDKLNKKLPELDDKYRHFLNEERQ